MPNTTETKKPAERRDASNISRLTSEISEAIGKHEKMSADLMEVVSSRLTNLEAMSKTLTNLKAKLGGGVSEETARLLRKMTEDVSVNLRLTASMRVPLQRGPTLKNYKLMAGE